MVVLGRFCNDPGIVHIELVKYALHCVSGTLELDSTFDGEINTPDDVIGYTDFDLARLKTD